MEVNAKSEGTYYVEREAFTELSFDCSLCQVKCTRKRTFSDHLIGKQHKKKLEMLHPTNRNFQCEICNVKANDQGGLDMHLAGKKHKKKLVQAGSA